MMLCNACQLLKTNELRCMKRTVISPLRKRSINSMSPEEVSTLYNNTGKQQKVLKQKYGRLIARLECKNCEFIVEEDSSTHKILHDVLCHLKSRWSHTTSDVTKLLGEDSNDKCTDKEKEGCASYICETIKNLSLHCNKD